MHFVPLWELWWEHCIRFEPCDGHKGCVYLQCGIVVAITITAKIRGFFTKISIRIPVCNISYPDFEIIFWNYVLRTQVVFEQNELREILSGSEDSELSEDEIDESCTKQQTSTANSDDEYYDEGEAPYVKFTNVNRKNMKWRTVAQSNLEEIAFHGNELLSENILQLNISGLGLKQIIEEPTRVCNSSSTLIDHVVIVEDSLVINSGVIDLHGVSDHCTDIQSELFLRDLNSIPWDIMYRMNTIDEKVTFFNHAILDLFNTLAPLKLCKFHKP
ncbi:hypothetical protein FQR65_LT09014 [Abscondita terminalis]|nr:hypothetical protein FQR65_LT09014 [Abscondita terminalis]